MPIVVVPPVIQANSGRSDGPRQERELTAEDRRMNKIAFALGTFAYVLLAITMYMEFFHN